MSNWGLWVAIGFLGQALFTARFLVQWVASERKRDSIVPPAFWWLSLAGGSVLFAYVVHRRDPVLIVGQGMGVFIYVRNLMLVAKGKRRASRQQQKAADALRQQTAGPAAAHATPEAGGPHGAAAVTLKTAAETGRPKTLRHDPSGRLSVAEDHK